ncbi:MAG: hypothetical protein E4H01_06510 [Lysobacterales bacterium]|nr:MAG: hypothetical protein E4H01_06510 [Xanthomonadales bacterium]
MRRGALLHNRDDIQQAVQRVAAEGVTNGGWPWIPYLLARAYAALELGGWRPIRPEDGRRPEESYSDAVWRNLREAIDLEPRFEVARTWLVSLLVAGGDRLLREDQRMLLEQDIGQASPYPDALLVWARHMRTRRQYDSALALFERSATLGGDISRLALERARTLRALHDSAAASAAYWFGLEHLTPTGRELYRYDLAWIVGADSLAVFDRVPAGEVEGWMRRFWAERDAAAANRPGDRLSEHLRRWVVAYARYRVRSPWRRTMYDGIDLFFENADCLHLARDLYNVLWQLPPVHAGDLRGREWLLDHRGIFYLRHGEPLQRFGPSPSLPLEDFVSGLPADTPDATQAWTPWARGSPYEHLGRVAGPPGLDTPPPAGPPRQNTARFTESWLYFIDGELQLVHFRDSYAVGMYAATTLASVLPYEWHSPGPWLAVAGTMPEYRAAAARIAMDMSRPVPDRMGSCWKELQAADARSRADVAAALRSDSDSPLLVHRWQSVIQMFALGDDRNEKAFVLLSFALGGDSLAMEALSDGRALYKIHFRVVAWEHASGRTVTVDTTRQFVRESVIPPGSALVAFLEVPLWKGEWQVAVRVMQGSDSAGAYALRRSVDLTAEPDIALSDIVLGIAGSPAWRATDGLPFPVNAIASWPAGSEMEVFFDVLGLAEREPFRMTIQIQALDSRTPGQELKIQTPERALGPVVHLRRTIGLANLPPGDYRLTVTVEAGSHRATRSQVVRIAAPQ